tara:strand:- start:78 stop:875 length:798 start_codon:yes stop_codon:yes gene_type:complete
MFYEKFSNELSICPKFYGVVKNDSKNLGVLLEDYSVYSEWILNPEFKIKEDIDCLISVCSKLHIQYWNKVPTNIVKTPNDVLFQPSWGEFCKSKYEQFKEKWLKTSEECRIFESILNNFEKIQNHLSQPPLTLCHGDIKALNMFKNVKTNELCLIDWQYISKAKGVQDITFFVIESLEKENNELETYIKEAYYKEITKVVFYSREKFEIDWMISMCYFPFYVAMWFGTLDTNELIDSDFPKRFIERYKYVLLKSKTSINQLYFFR